MLECQYLAGLLKCQTDTRRVGVWRVNP